MQHFRGMLNEKVTNQSLFLSTKSPTRIHTTCPQVIQEACFCGLRVDLALWEMIDSFIDSMLYTKTITFDLYV